MSFNVIYHDQPFYSFWIKFRVKIEKFNEIGHFNDQLMFLLLNLLLRVNSFVTEVCMGEQPKMTLFEL